MDDYRLVRAVGASGRTWIVDERENAVSFSPGQTSPFYGWPEDDPEHRHWVQRALGESEPWEEDRESMRRAWAIAQLPEVAASPYIHAPVDFAEPFNVYLVSELAETDLGHELRRRGPLPADELAELEQRLRAGLAVLHGLGLVHCDVREDNVLRVGGEWKLGDLGGVVPADTPMLAIQRDPVYRPPGLAPGSPASPENDLYALAVLLDHAKG